MIQLRSDCLEFETASGESIPCAAEQVTVELIGEAVASLDKDLVRQAAAAVLHYFKHELGRSFVTVGEFTLALERVLRGFGLEVQCAPTAPALPPVTELDLRLLAFQSGQGFELIFFQRLREELDTQLRQSPRVLRFKGLRGCVKQLMGARHWSGRCQSLNDQIVEFLRRCLGAQRDLPACALVID
jgi:hypothetical protein